jgi:VIT1/CCC1 family predicted Fe2+/Mn2+ transporter
MFGLSSTQFRLLVGAVAAFLTTVTALLPVEPALQAIIIGLIAAVAGYIVPKE